MKAKEKNNSGIYQSAVKGRQDFRAAFRDQRSRNKELIEILKQSVSVIQQWHGNKSFDIYFNNAPEMKLIRLALSNDNQETQEV